MIDLAKHMAWVVWEGNGHPNRRGTVPCLAADNETAVKDFIRNQPIDSQYYYFVTDMDNNPAPFELPSLPEDII